MNSSRRKLQKLTALTLLSSLLLGGIFPAVAGSAVGRTKAARAFYPTVSDSEIERQEKVRAKAARASYLKTLDPGAGKADMDAEAARVEAAWTSYMKTSSDKNKAAAEAGTTAGTAAGGGGGGNKKDKKESKRDKKKKGGQKTKPGEGELPKGVERFDPGNEATADIKDGRPLDKPHAHFKNGAALNLDGTLKHSGDLHDKNSLKKIREAFTRDVREWWREIGGVLPEGL